MNWQSLCAAKEVEIRQLATAGVSEVTPSIRNFAQYVTTHKQGLALIVALKRSDPQTGRSWPDKDLVSLARECDEAEVGAVAVYTEPSAFGSSLGDLRAIAAAVSAPILRLDLVLHPSQIYHSRLYGADAVLLSANALDTGALATLITLTSAVHITPVVAIQTQSELEHALAAGAFILGIDSPTGTLDLTQIDKLALLAPTQRTVIALNEINTPEEYTDLQGKVDAVVAGTVLLDAPDASAALIEIVKGRSPA
jgi:indole-3-glycerol phosphate synthase